MNGHRRPLGSLILILSIIIFMFSFTSSQPQVQASIIGISPPASGTWNINQNTVVTDRNLIINGSIIVRSWYYLKLVRSTLRMNLASDGQYGIYVEPSGAVNMTDNSKILNYTSGSYYFYVKGHAYFDNFEIQGVGYGTAGPENETLYLYSPSNILTNGHISHGKRGGVYLLQGNNVVTNVTIHDISKTPYVGIAFWLAQRSTTNDNTFTDVTAYNCWTGFNEDGHRNKLIGGAFYNSTGYGLSSYGESFYAEDIVVHDSEYGIQTSGTGVTAYAENSILKDLIGYNLHVDALNVNSWSRNITMESFTAYNLGGPVFGIGEVKYAYGSEPYNITVKNGVGYDSGYYGGESTVLGGIGFFENVTDVTVRNVEIYSSRLGIAFRGGSNPIGYFSNINIIDSNFHNRAYESDVYVNYDTMLTNVNFINTNYSNLTYNGGGSITSKWNTSLGAGYTQIIHSGSTNRRTGVVWDYDDAANKITMVQTAPSGTTSRSITYCAYKGQPMNVSGAASWSYNPDTKILSINATHSSPATIQITWSLVGDVNFDHLVNVIDAAIVSAHWYPGPPIGPLGYATNFDFNGDGVINLADAAIINAYWTGPPKGPLAP